MADEPNIELINDKWQNILPQYESNWFELAIVDPPYGIGESGGDKKRNGGYNRIVKHKKKDWDNSPPDREYFEELRRVSKNQCIFGANYYPEHLTRSMGWVVWDKKIGGDFSDGELIYTSFEKALRIIPISYHHDTKGGHNRIHPTQKPVALYKWLLTNYANEGDRILDTHLGSGSSAIAAYQKGHDFVGIECDKEYFDDMLHRYKKNTDPEYALKAWQEQSESEGQQTIFS